MKRLSSVAAAAASASAAHHRHNAGRRILPPGTCCSSRSWSSAASSSSSTTTTTSLHTKLDAVGRQLRRVQRRDLAVKINVGHGPGGGLPSANTKTSTNIKTSTNTSDTKTSTNTSGIYPERSSGAGICNSSKRKAGSSGNQKFRASPEQLNVARLELERMRRSTDRLLALLSSTSAENADGTARTRTADLNSPAAANELRVVLHYWTTRWYSHHHPYLTATPTVSARDDAGAVMAERLLDAIVAFDDVGSEHKEGVQHESLVDRVISVDGNAALVNLIEAHLLPCTTTGAGPMGSASSASGIGASPASSGVMATSKSIDVRVWIRAIQNALRVCGKM